MGEIGFTKLKKRPDKEETGVLKASTDLYYREGGKTEPQIRPRYKRNDRPVLELKRDDEFWRIESGR
jgi:hypothetical protein